MANYCTAADVQFLLGYKAAFSADTTPTLTQINSYIVTITGVIDFALKSVGITTQPSDTDLVAVLKVGCMDGVACKSGMSRFGNNRTVNDSQPNSYCQDFKALLKDIREHPENYGAVTGDETFNIGNNVTDGTNTEAEINDMIPDNEFEY